jgi:hypothetical protein
MHARGAVVGISYGTLELGCGLGIDFNTIYGMHQ